jgi:selenocysteine lyase/cysteine desulfurase
VPALAAAVKDAAQLLGADAKDCVPVVNATTGITTMLAAVPLGPGDAILTLSSAYSAVKTAIGRAAAKAGASVVEVHMDLEVCSKVSHSLKLCILNY